MNVAIDVKLVATSEGEGREDSRLIGDGTSDEPGLCEAGDSNVGQLILLCDGTLLAVLALCVLHPERGFKAFVRRKRFLERRPLISSCLRQFDAPRT